MSAARRSSCRPRLAQVAQPLAWRGPHETPALVAGAGGAGGAAADRAGRRRGRGARRGCGRAGAPAVGGRRARAALPGPVAQPRRPAGRRAPAPDRGRAGKRAAPAPPVTPRRLSWSLPKGKNRACASRRRSPASTALPAACPCPAHGPRHPRIVPCVQARLRVCHVRCNWGLAHRPAPRDGGTAAPRCTCGRRAVRRARPSPTRRPTTPRWRTWRRASRRARRAWSAQRPRYWRAWTASRAGGRPVRVGLGCRGRDRASARDAVVMRGARTLREHLRGRARLPRLPRAWGSSRVRRGALQRRARAGLSGAAGAGGRGTYRWRRRRASCCWATRRPRRRRSGSRRARRAPRTLACATLCWRARLALPPSLVVAPGPPCAATRGKEAAAWQPGGRGVSARAGCSTWQQPEGGLHSQRLI